MNALRIAVLAAGTLALASTSASAQLRSSRIPPGQMPPPGLCRVWIDGVAAGRQPRATDCATARMNAPANSRVIYGGQSQGRVSLDPRGATSGRYDPRADPRSPIYDPRFDPNSRVYDPRNGNGSGTRGTYDPRRDPNSTVYDPRYDPNSRVYDPRTRTDGRDRDGVYESRQGDKDREKWERKREKEFEKAERKRNKHGRDDGDDGDDDDEHEEGQRGRSNAGNHNRGHGRGHG